MNNLIKKLLNYFCWILTLIVNQGQKLMCYRESKLLYNIPKGIYSQETKREYKEYKKFLKQYGLRASKRDFFVYRHYLYDRNTSPMTIIPAYVVNNYLTPLLNPVSYSAYFEDKNMFDRIFPLQYMPKTLFRRMDLNWFDGGYKPLTFEQVWEIIENLNKIGKFIIKPTKGSSSGRGIEIYENKNGVWQNVNNGVELERSTFSIEYGDKDLIIQEVLEQHPYINQFCDTAICTLRSVIYNSPVDNKCHNIWSGIRIGNKGSIVDNVHAGGLIFGIDKNGNIDNFGIDQYGVKFKELNGIDFSKNNFTIPNYPEIIKFCKEMACLLLPNRFISFDIALDKEGNPKIIEYNLRGYPNWVSLFTGRSVLGDKTEEILSYITKNHRRAVKFYYSIN